MTLVYIGFLDQHHDVFFFIGQHSLLSELTHYTDTAVDYISHSEHITSKDQPNLNECVVRTQNMKLCNKRVFASII